MSSLNAMIPSIPGPILILGANGFIGWNFFATLAKARSDVHGIATRSNWRTESAPELQPRLSFENLGANFKTVVEELNPALIIDLAAYGSSPEQNDPAQIARTNYERVQHNLQYLSERPSRPMYLHAGSSSEYGLRSDGAPETESAPHSLYALAKVAAARLIEYFGTQKQVPCLHLRLFSVYGPFEEPTRLIPQLALKGLRREWPRLSAAANAHDFIHIDDVLSAFLMCARKLNQTPTLSGQIFNVGTGRQLSLKEVTDISRKVLNIPGVPAFGSAPGPTAEQSVGVANIEKMRKRIGWLPQVSFERGFETVVQWWKADAPAESLASQRDRALAGEMISIIVAIPREEPDVRTLYERVRTACEKARVRFELIFVTDRRHDGVNDRRHGGANDVIRDLSLEDHRVTGVNLAANNGSQRAFWVGLQHARGQACVLIEGDLQDPPEMIEEFVKEWRNGSVLVIGRHRTRAKSGPWSFGLRAFYGDFSLMDRRVVDDLLRYSGRDPWIRSLRTRLGYEASFVDYQRPERPLDRSTRSFAGLLAWANRGRYLFTGEPLRRWNRFLAFVALPGCLITFVMLNYRREEEWPVFALLFLGVATLGMMAEILIAQYRRGEPPPTIESLTQKGKTEMGTRS